MAEYSERLEDLLDHYLIDNEELEKKKEMGGVGYLINGNMCLGIYEDFLVARIGKYLSETLVGRSGVRPYLPDEGLYDDFIMVEEKVYKHPKALHKFVDQSIEYTADLSPKNQNQPDFDDLDLSQF